MSIKDKNILLIEDDADLRLATKTYLEAAGYQNISLAENGADGFAKVGTARPALVLLDRKMPGQDGLSVLENIKETYGDEVEVVMLTAYRDKTYITDAMRKGAFNYIVKDEDPDFMLHTIENALRFHEKSSQRKHTEREIYELLIKGDDLIREGYSLEAFKKVLQDKICHLVDDVIHTDITDCHDCKERVCQFTDGSGHRITFGQRTLNSGLGDDPPLFVFHRDDGNSFFSHPINLVDEKQRDLVQSVVYVPFIDQPSPALLRFLQEKVFSNDTVSYGCIYIFSAKKLGFTPEEKRLLRSFFNRFMIAMRTARLVDKINSLNKYRLLGEMAAMVVHQISPVITPLTDYVQKADAEKAPQGTVLIKELRRMVDELRHFTNGLVEEYDLDSLDLLRVIQQAETMFALKMPRHIELRHTFPEQAPIVYGDADRLRQVFTNLFLNAAQAIQDENQKAGRIETIVMTQGTMAEIHVRDNGIGVPKEIVPKLFNSYVSTKTGGTGLGLCLASDILRRHGGRIEYNSEYPSGAEFIVRLPLAIEQ